MSAHRSVHSGAFLEMAGVSILWAVLLFAIGLVTVLLVSTIIAPQIGLILGILGIAPK